MKKVIVAGHVCLDITPVFPAHGIHRPGDILIPGKLLNVGPAEVHAGGAVVNTGIAMKLMGAEVSLMGKIGEDAFGSMVLETLRHYDAEQEMIVSSLEGTSYTVVLAMPGMDRKRYDEWQVRSDGRDITEILDPEHDIRPLADQCMSMGVRILMIKCGTPGLYCRTAEATALSAIGERLALDTDAWSELSVFEKSYVPDRVLSGTGAGDTCIAAFLTALLQGYAPEMALHLAAATGACCVTAYDALGGLLPLREIEQRIADGWEKIG